MRLSGCMGTKWLTRKTRKRCAGSPWRPPRNSLTYVKPPGPPSVLSEVVRAKDAHSLREGSLLGMDRLHKMTLTHDSGFSEIKKKKSHAERVNTRPPPGVGTAASVLSYTSTSPVHTSPVLSHNLFISHHEPPRGEGESCGVEGLTQPWFESLETRPGLLQASWDRLGRCAAHWWAPPCPWWQRSKAFCLGPRI